MSMYGEAYRPLDASENGTAKQSMKDECDVNLIVSRRPPPPSVNRRPDVA